MSVLQFDNVATHFRRAEPLSWLAPASSGRLDGSHVWRDHLNQCTQCLGAHVARDGVLCAPGWDAYHTQARLRFGMTEAVAA